MSQHAEYHYSVTLKTDDEAVLHCFRALGQYAQTTVNVRIPWGGTKKKDWERDKHHVTFHFSKPEYRSNFVNEVKRLFSTDLFEQVGEDDNDPATPQS